MSPRPFRSFSAVALILLLVLIGCTASPAGTSNPAEESTAASESAPPSSTAASPSEAADAAVLVADSDLGEILTDPDGMVIYYFANDSEGTSTCEDDCLANWPPVEAAGTPSAGEGVSAELGSIERSDGTTQLTVNGFPAYHFAGDDAAGDTNGQGVGGIWWVFGADGEPIES